MWAEPGGKWAVPGVEAGGPGKVENSVHVSPVQKLKGRKAGRLD